LHFVCSSNALSLVVATGLLLKSIPLSSASGHAT
jgi:hypothetical protein